MESIVDQALEYAWYGWPVIPCEVNGKKPICAHGVNDATTDEVQIRAWWERTPNANVGIATGKQSGLYIVDIDRHGNADGFETLRTLDVELEPTIAVKTAGGGEHRYYRWTKGDEPSQCTNVNGYSGIDVRGNGGYVLGPGSVINGSRYEWMNAENMVEFPEVFKKKAPAAVSPERASPPASIAPEDMNDVLERARAYLAKCDPAIQGQSGHSSLLKAASKMVVGFNLSDADALSLLWREYNPRCVPPWNPDDPKDVKDFERKVSEARAHPVGEYGGLLHCHDDGGQLVEIGKRVAFGRFGTVSIAKKVEMPELMLNPPGYVGEIYRFILDGSNRPQPLFALASALITVGTAYARCVRDKLGNLTNLFFLGVANPGSGKDWPQKSIQHIFDAVWDKAGFFVDNIQLNDVTSDAALEVKLSQSPVLALIVDEVSGFFQAIKSAERSGGCTATVKRFIKQAYSWHAGDKYHGKLYAARSDGRIRPAIRITEPFLSFFGMTQPAVLPNVITTEELNDGFLPRMMLLAPEIEPPEDCSRFANRKVPDEISDRLVRWVQLRHSTDNEIMATESLRKPSFVSTVPSTEEAEKVFADLRARLETKRHSNCHADPGVHIYSRVHENARRIALIIAIGNVDMPEYARIDVAEATFGCTMAEYLGDVMYEYLKLNLADGELDRAKSVLRNAIAKSGTKGITKSALLRMKSGIRSKRLRDDALMDLLESEEVSLRKEGKKCIFTIENSSGE